MSMSYSDGSFDAIRFPGPPEGRLLDDFRRVKNKKSGIFIKKRVIINMQAVLQNGRFSRSARF